MEYVNYGLFYTHCYNQRDIHQTLESVQCIARSKHGSATKVVQASRWLGPQAARDAQVSRTLNRKLPDELKTLSYRHLVG